MPEHFNAEWIQPRPPTEAARRTPSNLLRSHVGWRLERLRHDRENPSTRRAAAWWRLEVRVYLQELVRRGEDVRGVGA